MDCVDLKGYGLSDRFEQEATLYNGLPLARVIEQHRDLYKIISERGELQSSVSGKFLYAADGSMDFPTAGDWIMADRIDGTSD